jgi:altronate dehydratase large subunit
MLIEKGATVALTEDCELVCGADKLAARAVTPEIGNSIKKMAQDTIDGWKTRHGIDFIARSGAPIEELEKASLKHAEKAGYGPITGFFDMSEQIKGSGIVILNAPNTDLECVTALAGSGCNVTIFTTGRGTPVGSPAAITVKATATQKTFDNMPNNIDYCCADVIDGKESIEDAAGRLVDMIINAANGEATKAEIMGHNEIAVPVRGITF